MDLKDRVREVRKLKGLTISELSKKIGVPERTISNYELGERKISVEYITLLNTHLGTSLNWLISGEGEMFIGDAPKKNVNFLTEEEKPNMSVEQALEVIKIRYNLTEDQKELLREELLSSGVFKEICFKLIQAKKGNKECIRDIENLLIGFKLASGML